MSLSIGIVGLANVGKSTLFETLTKKPVAISNYPFCTIDPNVGIVEVADERLNTLAQLFNSAKKIPTVVQFTDIAGLVRNAHKGEGLGNQFLANIREVDAILFVVRCFENLEIIHVEKTVDPVRDIDIVNMELILKDLETLDKRIQKVAADAKTGKKVIADELEILKKLKEWLENGNLARQFISTTGDEVSSLRSLPSSSTSLILSSVSKELQLLTAKPALFILNSNTTIVAPELEKKIKDLNSDYVLASLRDEYDGSKLSEDEKKELGLSDSKLNEIIRKSYQVLGLITFFTTGPDETRAWTIKKGTKGPQAAGTIHTDFENKFICAEVIGWEKLIKIGGENPNQDAWSAAARLGQLKTEGKEYVVQDGDIMVIKHGQ